mgnify:CR=1 FL=1
MDEVIVSDIWRHLGGNEMYQDDIRDLAARIGALSRRWGKAPGDILQDAFQAVGEYLRDEKQRRLDEWLR